MSKKQSQEVAAVTPKTGGCCSCFSLRGLSFLVVVAAVLVGLCFWLDNEKFWVFDNVQLQAAAKRGIAAAHKANKGNATYKQVIDAVIAEVKAKYPNYINDKRGWIFNNAGGAMGAMTVLHASVTEYVIIFGTPLGTEGHTGRFISTDYFTIIAGEQWAAPANGFEKEIYRPGDQHILLRGTAKQYKIPDTGCYALEYARGNIPSMMGFGLFDTFFSTLDIVTLWQTVEVSAIDTIHYLMMGKI